MTIPSWPESLPQAVPSDSYEETPPDLAVSSDMDIGPAKRRRRASNGPTAVKATLRGMSKEQAATLLAFYFDDLQSVLRFSWVHPRTGAPAEIRIKGAPTITANGALFSAAMELEILP